MKIRILTMIVAAISICTHAYAQDANLDRDRVFEMIDSYEAVSALFFEPEFNGPMSKQLRLQAAAIPAEEFRNASPELITHFQRLEQTIAELSIEPTANSDKAPAKIAGTSTTAATAITSQEFPQPRDINVGWAVQVNNPGERPSDDPPGTIGANGNCDSTDPLNGRQRYDAQTAAIALEAVADIADNICQQEVLVGDFSIACIVTDVAFLIASGINENVKNCEALIDTVTLVGSHARLEHISEDLGDLSSGIGNQIETSTSQVEQQLASSENEISNAISDTADQLDASVTAAADGVESTLTASEQALTDALENTESKLVDTIAANTRAVTTRINSRSDRIDTAISDNLESLNAFRRNNFRYHIEKNLGEKSGAMALFVLPTSLGGSIETVDAIVDATIENTIADPSAGNQARRNYDRARGLYADGKFKDAYQWYRAAYQAVNRQNDASGP